MRTKKRWGTLIALGAAATLFPSGMALAAVTQGVPAPYVNSSNSVNGSDPHVKPCVNRGVNGFCLFTSQDLNESDTTSTLYPMTFFTPNGFALLSPPRTSTNERSASWCRQPSRIFHSLPTLSEAAET
jgi:hypothetical protein